MQGHSLKVVDISSRRSSLLCLDQHLHTVRWVGGSEGEPVQALSKSLSLTTQNRRTERHCEVNRPQDSPGPSDRLAQIAESDLNGERMIGTARGASPLAGGMKSRGPSWLPPDYLQACEGRARLKMALHPQHIYTSNIQTRALAFSPVPLATA